MPPMNSAPIQGLADATPPQADSQNASQGPMDPMQAAMYVLKQAAQEFGPEVIGAIHQLLQQQGPGGGTGNPMPPQIGAM